MADSHAVGCADARGMADAVIEEAGNNEIEKFLDHIDQIDREYRWGVRFEKASTQPCDEDAGFVAPLVFELGDIRSLLANWAYVQSAMSISDPNRLMLEYTQAMMGFLLFNPTPKTIEIIGLGGGSLAKYCHKFLPESTIRGVEVDWDVLAVADQFCMPSASKRFEIIWADGADFVTRDTRSTDILLIDGFDSGGQPPGLCSMDFYRACRSRLNPDGILVVNLCNYPGRHGPMLARLRECFGDILTAPAEGDMNIIVFAFKNRGFKLSQSIRELAKTLQLKHPLPMTSLVEKIFGNSPDGRL